MELNDIVISLSLAEKLKNIGINQVSLFSYFKGINGDLKIEKNDYIQDNYKFLCSAFTSDELFQFLPSPVLVNTNTFVVADSYSYRKITHDEVESFPYANLDIHYEQDCIVVRYVYLGAVIAFNKTLGGLYINLISNRETLSEALSNMIYEIYSNKLTLIHFNIQEFKN